MAPHAAVTIRVAESGDHADILDAVDRLGRVPLPAWRTPEQVAGVEREALRAVLSSPDDAHLVIVACTPEGGFAGFVYVQEELDYFTRSRHAHVDMIVVTSAAEGLGVGTALLDAAEAWARGRLLPFLSLNVFAENRRARSLYERLGYAPDTVKYIKVLDASATRKP
jgi:ribosomal protein S18 acetylase RimI-like enzyme